MMLHRFQASLLIALTLCSSACWLNFNKVPGVKKLTAPKPGPKTLAFRKNYCDESSPPRLRAGTPLTALIWDGDCGTGLTACAAGFDAVKGSLPSAYEELFSDLLDAGLTDGGSPDFVYHSCDIIMGVEPYLLGIEGLGFMRSTKHQAVLTDLAIQHGDANFNNSSTQRTLVRALFLTGKSQPAEEALRSLLQVHPQADTYKPEILKYLATWESDVAVDDCTKALETGKGPIEACIWYLGKRRRAEAYPLIVRRMEDAKDAAVRALGHLGNDQAVPLLEKTLAATPNHPLQSASLVALLNLGRDDLFPQFERQLRGRRLLSSGAEVTKPDVGMIEAATLEAIELEDAALRTKAFEVVEGLGDLEDATSEGWRMPVFHNAARASLGDAEATAALATLLDDPRKDVRHLVIRYVGGDFEQLRGLRVPDRSLLEPLARAYAMEPAPHMKAGIIWAAAYLGAE